MRLILPIILMFAIAGNFHGLRAEEIGCIDEAEYQKTRDFYADTFAKYDLPTVSQEFLEAISATEDLKDQVSDCQKQIGNHSSRSCDSLVTQLATKENERDALKTRFSMALQMQEYLMTLKVKLERPLCTK